jgi:hypothetical protein
MMVGHAVGVEVSFVPVVPVGRSARRKNTRFAGRSAKRRVK